MLTLDVSVSLRSERERQELLVSSHWDPTTCFVKKCLVADIELRLAKKTVRIGQRKPPPPDLALPGRRQGFSRVSGKKKKNTTTPDSADNRVIYRWRNGKEPPREDVSGEEDDVEEAAGG